MLLLEDRRFYTYIYLDPLKSGNFNYEVNGEIIHFDYEPFYVGKGHAKRIYDHLREARNKNIHNHKVHKIRKIWKSGYDPIVFKVKDFLTSIEALMLEEHLGFAIKLVEDGGTLTNARYPEGLSNGIGRASLETRKLQSKMRKDSGMAKGKNNPMYGNGFKLKGDKNGMYHKNHTENSKENMSKTKIKRKVAVGLKNNRYKIVDHIQIINGFFDKLSMYKIIDNYIPLSNEKLDRGHIKRIFNVLGFKNRGVSMKQKLENDEFISSHKHLQQYYIDNYEQLEKEYFDKKFLERHPDYAEQESNEQAS